MGLSNRREEQLKKMPIIESTVGKSKDGKYIVQRTTITHIKPIEYYNAIIDGIAKKEAELEAMM